MNATPKAVHQERVPTMLATAMATHKRVSACPRESLTYCELTIVVLGDEVKRLGKLMPLRDMRARP